MIELREIANRQAIQVAIGGNYMDAFPPQRFVWAAILDGSPLNAERGVRNITNPWQRHSLGRAPIQLHSASHI